MTDDKTKKQKKKTFHICLRDILCLLFYDDRSKKKGALKLNEA